MKKIDFDISRRLCNDKDFDKAIDHCFDGFEIYGGCCAHDCGLDGLLGVIVAWEEVRTNKLVEMAKSTLRESK